jgi:hypothetical protein
MLKQYRHIPPGFLARIRQMTKTPSLPEMIASLRRTVYGAILRRDVDPRAVAAALRRRRNDGLVEEVRAGRPFQEALYRKRAG